MTYRIHRKNRRRAPLLTGLLALGLLLTSGCGAGPDGVDLGESVKSGPTDGYGLLKNKPYDGQRIRFLVCCDTVPQFAALNKRTTEEFTERTGIKVEWANIPYASYLQKIVAESSIGAGTYDVVAWPDAWGPSLRIGVQPLDEVMKESGRDLKDFPESFRNAARAGTKDTTYGIPFRGFSYNYFYRKSTYRKLGLEPPQTWGEYAAQLKKLKKSAKRAPLAGQYGRGEGQNLNLWLSMLWSNGADLLDKRGEPAFTSPRAVRATKDYLAMIREGYSPRESGNWGEVESTEAMRQDRVEAVFTWAWQMDEFANRSKSKDNVVGDVGVGELPGYAGRKKVDFGYAWLLGMLDSSQHKGPAWEFLKWATHRETERKIAVDKSDPRYASSVMVHRSNMLDKGVNKANGGLPRLQEKSLRASRTVPMTRDWPKVMDILEVAINKMAHGGAIEPGLRRAAADIRDLAD